VRTVKDRYFQIIVPVLIFLSCCSTGAAVGAAFTANLGAAAAAAGTAVTSGLGAAASLLSSAAAGAGSGGSTPGDEAPGGAAAGSSSSPPSGGPSSRPLTRPKRKVISGLNLSYCSVRFFSNLKKIFFFFNLAFYCSVETLSGARERRRRRPLPGAVGAVAGPLSGPGRTPRHALW
jgi:hypothetical protein